MIFARLMRRIPYLGHCVTVKLRIKSGAIPSRVATYNAVRVKTDDIITTLLITNAELHTATLRSISFEEHLNTDNLPIGTLGLVAHHVKNPRDKDDLTASYVLVLTDDLLKSRECYLFTRSQMCEIFKRSQKYQIEVTPFHRLLAFLNKIVGNNVGVLDA